MRAIRGDRSRPPELTRWIGFVGVALLVVLAGCSGIAGVGPGGPGPAEATPTDPETDPDADPTPTTAPLPSGDPPGGTTSLADAAVTIRGQGADEMGYGAAVGDVNGDGTPDVVVGAPFHNATGTRSGAAFVFFGPVEPGDLRVGDADVRLVGEAGGDWAGNSVAVADVSDDGVGDLVLGAPRNDEAGDTAGAVYVVHGGPALGGEIPLGEADAKLVGASVESYAGYSVAAANVTGGPAADVVVGAPRTSAAGAESGAVYVVDGARVASAGSLAEADATFVGEDAGDRAGRAVAVPGDVDGDGRHDVLVGAWRADGAANQSGAAYLLAGAAIDGESSLADAAVTLEGVAANDDAGFDVAGAGDVNGDGHADLLVGAPRNDAGGGTAGAVYLVHGGPDLPRSLPLTEADATFLGARGDHAGWAAEGVGDVDCDGTPDLLVGAPWNDAGGENAGAAYLVSGGAAGRVALPDATATYAGTAAGDQVGRVDALEAVRGGNTTGLVVGAPFGEAPASAHVAYVSCDGSGR